jgi:ABC-type transporter Mla subunit MlaD
VLDDFEDVALNAAEVLGAVAGRDLATIVDSAHEALAGRGSQLHALVGDLGTVVGALADQRTDLLAAIDGLALLGATMAPASDAVGALIDDLGATSALLAEHRDRIVTALGDLTDLAGSLNDVVLEPHAERLGQLLSDLDPVVATLATNRHDLDVLISDLLRFTTLIPMTISDTGQLNAFAYLFLGGAAGASAP